MQPKDEDKAKPADEKSERKPVDEENLDSVSGASVPVSIGLDGPEAPPPGQAKDGPGAPGS